MTPLEAGDEFAGFTVDRILHSTGSGQTLLATRGPDPRPVLLRIVDADAPDLARIARDHDALASIGHPGIPRAAGRGEHEGRRWFASEYVDAPDLVANTVTDPLPPSTVARIVAETADALDAAAARGVLHSGVRPAAIRLPDGRPTILGGFGDTPDDAPPVTAGAPAAAFASPELLQGLPVDPRSDQYSLACVAFALLTGTVPYAGPNDVALGVAHARDPIPTAAGRRPGHLPPAVDEVFRRGLAKAPADRFPDSRSFAAALATALSGPAAVGPPGPVPAPADIPRRPAGRRTGLVVGAVAVIVLLAVGGTVFALRSGDDAPGSGLTPVAVSTDLPSLEKAPSGPRWQWTPPPPPPARAPTNDSLGIVAGTAEYAVGVAETYEGPRMNVIDPATGRTVRSFPFLDSSTTKINACSPMERDRPTNVIACWYEEAGSTADDRVAVVDLDTGRVTTNREVDGHAVAVTGDRVVLSSGEILWSTSVDGREWRHDTGSNDDRPANGSPVVMQVSRSGGRYLRSVADGRVVFDFARHPDATWQPFRDGFVVADDTDEGTRLTFFDADGQQTATAEGQWKVIEPASVRTDRSATVTSLPILVSSDGGTVAAFDPTRGRTIWEKEVEATGGSWSTGFGTKAVIKTFTGYVWFDCYDGSGGEVRVPTDASLVPLGSDGTRLAFVDQSSSDSSTPPRLLVFGPDGDEPLWTMTLPGRPGRGYPVAAHGRLFAGGDAEFGDRRIL